MSLSDHSGVSSRPGGCTWQGAVLQRDLTADQTSRGATGDVRPMDERSDAAGPPTATLARSEAQTRSDDVPPHAVAGASAAGGPVSAQRGAHGPAAGARRRRGPVLPQLLLAGVCGGYGVGAAFGWGSREVALVMGDFGLSAAALIAAVSCLLYARARQSRFRPAWLLFALSSAMAAGGNARLGLVRGGAGPRGTEPLHRRPVLPLLRAARHRRPARPRQAPGHQGRLGLSRAGRLADRRLAAHALLEPRARPHRAVCRARAWPPPHSRSPIRCSTSCWSAWCSRCTSGARPPTAPRSTPPSPPSP